MNRETRVICICGGDGFPKGSATAVRITLVGKALLSAGIDFELLHCGPSPTPLNQQSSGSYEGIRFRYTTFLQRPSSWPVRLFAYAAAVTNVTGILLRKRARGERPVIYLYVMQGALYLYLGFLCRLLNFPLVQEMCEWWPGEVTCSWLTRHLYQSGIIFRQATGVLAISSAIEERTLSIAERQGLELMVHRLPAVADISRFVTSHSEIADKFEDGLSRFVWCGTVDGWIRDVLFLVSAFGHLVQKGSRSRLVIVGSCSEVSRRTILAHAQSLGFPSDHLELAGWVSNAELSRLYRSAAALLMPLWDDDRSVTRMPNKLPEYLCSGRPIITSPVGAVREVLTDEENACLVPAGDCTSFAQAMMRVLDQPEWASALGAEGRRLGLDQFDYRSYAEGLARFFTSCTLRNSPKRLAVKTARSIIHWVRNVGCSAAALIFICAGSVRRAKRRALTSGTVTAVYFHKPNRKLFCQCMRWLARNGYKVISLEELLAFLRGERSLPAGATWLSVDDGAAEVYRDLYPVLTQWNIPATLFIPSGIVAGDGRFPWILKDRLHGMDQSEQRHAITIPELQIMAQSPVVAIGSHTVTHAKLPWCDTEQLNFELGESKRALEALLQRPVHVFSYPNGYFDERSAAYLAGNGYSLAATTESALIDRNTLPYRVPRFSVADNIWLPEAICNMVGLWRPSVEAVKQIGKRIMRRFPSELAVASEER